MPYSPTLEALRAAVDDELRAFLLERKSSLPEAGELISELQRILGGGGKRLRPAFCYWGFRAAGGKNGRAIIRAAASLELLHTFAIVHDDIMDASEERRGLPTAHSLHGVNFALLVGDFALVLADHLLFSSGFGPVEVAAAFGPYSRMRQQVIAGQLLDVQAAAREVISEDEARWIAVLKSGRYTIQEPLAIGAALAGAHAGVVEALAAFGGPLGEAFQLRDDLLGTFGERAALGKPVDSDIREGKRNLLYAKTLTGLASPDAHWFVEHWGAKERLSEAEVDRLRDLVESSGARAATETLLDELTDEARRAVGALDLDEETRAAFEDLVRESTDRRA